MPHPFPILIAAIIANKNSFFSHHHLIISIIFNSSAPSEVIVKLTIKPKVFYPTILISLLLRLLIAPSTNHIDHLIHAEWGQYLSTHPFSSFYTSENWTLAWPNDIPLVNLLYFFSHRLYLFVLWLLRQSTNIIVHYRLAPSYLLFYFDFVKSFNHIISPSTPFPASYLLILKIIPIISDLILASLFYRLTRRPLISIIYLFSPFSWYLSSLWGQTDQIAYIFTFLSFTTPSPFLFFVGLSLKPTSAFLLPLFFIIFRHRRGNSLLYFLPPIIFIILTLIPFHTPPLILFHKIFNRPFSLSTNAYNFWHPLTLFPFPPSLAYPITLISLLIYLYFHRLILPLLKKPKIPSILSAIFIISFGSWFFLTNMLDRYSFTAIATGLILCHYYPKIWPYWLGLSLIYWLNLFRSWWFPPFLLPLQNILTYHNFVIGIPLSLLNLYFFLKITRILITQKPGIRRVSSLNHNFYL